jgi:large subunit ribosomal protein L2
LIPNRGGQIVRAAGTSAKLLAKEGDYVTLRLPSKKLDFVKRIFGEVSNNDIFNPKW